MRKISKGMAIAAAVMAIGGGSLVAMAQTGGQGAAPGPGMMGDGPGTTGYGPGGPGMMGYGPGGPGMMGGYGPDGGSGSMGFMRGFGGYGPVHGAAGVADPAAGLDALKAALAIRPEQQAAWDGYAKAVQDVAAQMHLLHGSIDSDKLRAMTWQEHQAVMAKLFDQRAAAFKAVDAAGSTLVTALDSGQTARLLSSRLGFGGPGRLAAGGFPPCPGFGGAMMGRGPGGWR